MQDALKLELQEAIVDADQHYLQNIFKSEERDIKISQFVATSGLYDKKKLRWRGTPRSSKKLKEKKLYKPFSKLFEGIFEHFEHPDHGRDYLKTDDFYIPHKDGSTSAPDFMVMGSGVNFPGTEDKEDGLSLGYYRRCVSVGDIKTEHGRRAYSDTVQLASYARQCFLEQPNRGFVYAMLLTESNLCLLICERSGVLRSPFFDIHQNPGDFVRIILGFCSPEDDRVGFDTSFSWKKKATQDGLNNKWVEEDQGEAEIHGGQGLVDEEQSGMPARGQHNADTEGDPEVEARKAKAAADKRERVDREAKQRLKDDLTKIAEHYDQFIRLDDQFDKDVPRKKTYVVKDTMFPSGSLRGRGTKCWTVFDPDDEQRTLVIKDSWRTVGCVSEAQLLVEAVGLPGVGQIVAYQENQNDSISSFRAVAGYDTTKWIKDDRIFTRIVIEAYGGHLGKFKNPLHLLYAFRDSVKGHRNLFEAGFLHRDVSVNNILFGKDGVQDGFKGVLIDLDMAVCTACKNSLAGTFRIGTRAFQSINVLLSQKYGTTARPHDYLDDLESYLYSLAWICCTYTEPGIVRQEPKSLSCWDSDPYMATSVKANFLRHAEDDLTPYFKCLSAMFHSMGIFLVEHAERKLSDSKFDLPKVELKDLTDWKEHYGTFIGFIDDAINLLSASRSPKATNPDPTPHESMELSPEVIGSPVADNPTEFPIESSRKRRLDEIEDSDSPQKKTRLLSLGP